MAFDDARLIGMHDTRRHGQTVFHFSVLQDVNCEYSSQPHKTMTIDLLRNTSDLLRVSKPNTLVIILILELGVPSIVGLDIETYILIT